MKIDELDIDISLYQMFYTVYVYESFSKAAEALGVTQPSISYKIKKLEDQLGVKLFIRGNQLEPTQEAIELFPNIKAALSNIKMGEQKMYDLVNLKRGHICIGVPSHIGVFLLTDIIKKFNNIYSNIKINVISKPTKELFKLLFFNELDIIIDSSPIEDNKYNFVIKKISSERCSFVCHKSDHKWIGKKISIEDLLNSRLILPISTSSTTKSLIDTLSKKGIYLNPQFEISTSDMIAEMVDQKIGIGYLFEKTIDKYPNLHKIDIDVEVPSFDVYVIYKQKELSITVEHFISFVLNQM